jgi:tetratricopeptide (TPR) repeat protein
VQELAELIESTTMVYKKIALAAILLFLSVGCEQLLYGQAIYSPGERIIIVAEGVNSPDGKSDHPFWVGLALEVLQTRDSGSGQELLLSHFDRQGWVDAKFVRKPDDALKLFEKALEQSPEQENLLFANSLALWELNRLPEAIQTFDRLLERFPENNAYRNERAGCLMSAGEFSKALADFDELIAKVDKAESRINRGLCRQAMGNITGAREDFRTAIRLQPDQPQCYLRLAELEAAQQNPDGVIQVLGEMISTFPQDSQWRKVRADYWVRLGRLDQAEVDLEKIIELAPHEPQTHLDLATFLRDSGQIDKSIEKFSEMTTLFPDFWPAFLNRGVLLQNQGNYDRALDDLGRAIDISEEYRHFLRYHRGCIYLDMGNPSEAILDLDACIAVEPVPDAIIRRGDAYQRLGEHNAALQDFNRVLEYDANRHFARYLRASVYRQTGDAKSALTDYDFLIQQGIQSDDVYYNRGHARKTLKDWQGAIEDLTQALTNNPENLLYLNDLAWLLASVPDPNLREPQTAISHAQKACEISKWERGEIIDTLAVAHAAAGDFKTAVKLADQALENVGEKYTQEIMARRQLFSQDKPFVLD